MILGLIIAYLLIIIVDVPTIIRSNKIRRLIILHLTISFLGFTLSLLQILDKQPPSPSLIIANIIDNFIK